MHQKGPCTPFRRHFQRIFTSINRLQFHNPLLINFRRILWPEILLTADELSFSEPNPTQIDAIERGKIPILALPIKIEISPSKWVKADYDHTFLFLSIEEKTNLPVCLCQCSQIIKYLWFVDRSAKSILCFHLIESVHLICGGSTDWCKYLHNSI